MARRLGTVKCKGCARKIEVVNHYSNSDRSIGLEDHRMPDEKNRCPHAGLVLKLDGAWLRSALDYYSEEDVTWGN